MNQTAIDAFEEAGTITSLFDYREDRWKKTDIKIIKALMVFQGGWDSLKSKHPRNMYEEIPICWAVKSGAPIEVVIFMYENNVESSNQWRRKTDGWTLLHYAAWKNHHDIMNYLIEVNPGFVSIVGSKFRRTPLDYARRIHHAVKHSDEQKRKIPLEVIEKTVEILAAATPVEEAAPVHSRDSGDGKQKSYLRTQIY
jgi:hypothetical protein